MNNIVAIDRNIYGNDRNTQLLISSQGPNGSTSFIDRSVNGNTIVAEGSVYHSSAQSLSINPNGTSIYLPKKVGAVTSRLKLTGPTFNRPFIGECTFCIDLWYYQPATISGLDMYLYLYIEVDTNEYIWVKLQGLGPTYSDFHYARAYGLDALGNPTQVVSSVIAHASGVSAQWNRYMFWRQNPATLNNRVYCASVNYVYHDHDWAAASELNIDGSPSSIIIENPSTLYDVYLDDIRISVGNQRNHSIGYKWQYPNLPSRRF